MGVRDEGKGREKGKGKDGCERGREVVKRGGKEGRK
mgnify:FL=1